MLYPALILMIFFMWSNPPPKELICLYTKTPVIVDGLLDEWSRSGFITIADRKGISDNTAIVRTLWDEDNLYIAFEIKDKNLQAEQYVLDHPKLWLDDMIEFLFDTQNHRDSCWNSDDVIYHINLLGQKKDDRGSAVCVTNPSWNGSARYVIRMYGTLNDTADTDKGYDIEIAVSWKELEIRPSPGFIMGADFALGDKNISVFDWAGASPFRSPYAFGDLILKK